MENNTRLLLCLIEGNTGLFEINVPTGNSIYFLKKAIWNERNIALRDVDAADLVLWKLNERVSARSAETLAERISGLGELSQFAAELKEPVDRVLDVFPEQPRYDLLHIIVQKLLKVPPRVIWPLPVAPPNAVQRSDTVSAIYQKLHAYRFIQVCGTPASGKSTLAKLLARHIQDQEPNAHVIWIGGWRLDDVSANGGWYSYLKTRKGWIPGENTVFIFDEAQVSYKDTELWNELFKGIHDFPDRRAIAFVSYGSPSLFIDIEGTPMFVDPSARVSLLPTAHKDNLPAAGLLFTRAEFDELVSKHYPLSEYFFDPSFLEAVFVITQGHVGAMYSFLNIILGSDEYRVLKYSGGHYTWKLFQEKVNLLWFFQQVESTAAGVFRRGLPQDGDLRVPAVATVFSAVLRVGSVQSNFFSNFRENRDALQLCYSNGWLHTDNIDDVTHYFFPSWLHRWYIEWKLWGFSNPSIHPDNILDFVIDVVSMFSPHMLSTTRRVSSAGYVQRPPEAQYQDEFYRCCHTLSKGSLITFPEFGAAKGRVDFYIPAKQWGVELLRDGNQLAQHSGRFSHTGSYGTTLSLSDYIILDCRTTQPKVHHPQFQNLYHIVFDDKFSQVKILDNELKVVSRGEFVLLASSYDS